MFATFRRVVVDHIQYDFQARIVDAVDHFPELVNAIIATKAGFGREEVYRVVTPVISESSLAEKILVDKSMNRHEFDRRHAQGLQIVEDFLVF